MITDDTIERVREAADIVQIIGEHVSLKRTGTDYRGPCPFHQGTHRNFSVSPKKGIYYCFVCHEGGDVFTFLQKRLGMDWPSAVRYVADRAGVEVREVEARRDEPDPRAPLWEMNAAAAEFFQAQLWDDVTGRAARDYLALRRVGHDVAERFGLGFAPRDQVALRTHLSALGYEDEKLAESGLLVRRSEDGEIRPRFRGRLMFPILDAAGHHVGFGGRLLGPGEPKYLNSPDTPAFSKARLLYGLNWAKHAIRRENRVLVVEGYFDVVRLVASGVEPVVAPLGTALTAMQAALLARYAKTAFLLYDSDRAGLKATFRAGDELLRHGTSVLVVTLPDGEDPDTFVDKFGGDALRSQLESAVDVFERKVQLLTRAGWFADLQKKRRAIDRLLPTIRAASDSLTRDIYLTRAAEAAGVTKDLLAREVDELRQGSAAARRGGDAAEPAGSRTALARPRERRGGDRRRPVPGVAAERELVRVLLLNRASVEPLAERLDPGEMRDATYRAIFRALLDCGPAAAPAARADLLDEEAVQTKQELLDEPDAVVDAERALEDSLAVLRVRQMRERLAEIDREIRIANANEADALITEKRSLVREIGALGGKGFGPFGKSRS